MKLRNLKKYLRTIKSYSRNFKCFFHYSHVQYKILKFFFSLYYLIANFKGILSYPLISEFLVYLFEHVEISENLAHGSIEVSGNLLRVKVFKIISQVISPGQENSNLNSNYAKTT